MEYKDILYETRGSAVWITINRPDKYNAFRGVTCEELIHAITRAGWDRSVAAIVLTGASIRDVPKPVIARVNGFAIGGGNVLVTCCDLAIAGARAVFGQVGPRVESVDPGFGTALLARVVGEKKAREIWFLCRRYTSEQALQMGLINAVVADANLDAEVDRWCAEIAALSPTAIAIAKKSFNLDSESIRGISAMGMQALSLFYETQESREGVNAFLEKRPPVFRNP